MQKEKTHTGRTNKDCSERRQAAKEKKRKKKKKKKKKPIESLEIIMNQATVYGDENLADQMTVHEFRGIYNG